MASVYDSAEITGCHSETAAVNDLVIVVRRL